MGKKRAAMNTAQNRPIMWKQTSSGYFQDKESWLIDFEIPGRQACPMAA
jgi:hypothetical protein